MLVGLLFILAVVIFYRSLRDLGRRPAQAAVVATKKAPVRLTQTAEYADRLFKEKKFLAAEKAYLELIKVDHKNAQAYSRLGIIYSRLKNHGDAIECFQIASQLAPSAGSFHNLGLIFYENKNYIKSIAAFEKSIMFEPSAERYKSLARSYQKLANWGKMAATLEKAVEIHVSKDTLGLLANAYMASGARQKALEVYKRILELDPNDAKAKRAAGVVQT